MDGDEIVPPGSAVYQEFTRLYHLARSLRPTSVDRWNGELYSTNAELWGGFDPKSGAIQLSEDRVLRHLTGSTSHTAPRGQAQALATILHESTHAGMETDAPTEPNAVRTTHSLGTMEGFAEVRTVNDFEAFSNSAGYPGLTLDKAAYPGAHAAMDSLITQASGPAKDRYAFLDEGTRGPAVMHFDQLADGVVRNRLGEVVPDRGVDRVQVRAALIQTMKHEHWPTLPDRSAETGQAVAEDIRRALNAKVDEIRRHYRANPTRPFPADLPNPAAARTDVREGCAAVLEAPGVVREDRGAATEKQGEMRFLSGQAPAAQATRHAPSLGDGSRRAGNAHVLGARQASPTRTGPVGPGRR